MIKAINATREDYVRAIYILTEGGGEIGVTQIADRLGLRKSTVSERIKNLVADGLVVAGPYTAVELTPRGIDVGKKLTYKHRIIEVFLTETLGMAKGKVHAEAERLEHACSDEVIKRIATFLQHPEHDPHGSVIPTVKNWNC
jgi:DtxR family transcriptional regulator, Mn-dependent transcriptional regulator